LIFIDLKLIETMRCTKMQVSGAKLNQSLRISLMYRMRKETSLLVRARQAGEENQDFATETRQVYTKPRMTHGTDAS
jgi:hypothetical protein